MLQRSVFFLSDRTGITAETLGHSLLTQFDGIEWKKHYASFLDSAAKAQAIIEQINTIAEQEGQPALVFSTLLDPVMLASIRRADCVLFDFFETLCYSQGKTPPDTDQHGSRRQFHHSSYICDRNTDQWRILCL